MRLLFPGCENAAGKLKQKTTAAAAGIKFSKPGNGNLGEPCMLAAAAAPVNEKCLLASFLARKEWTDRMTDRGPAADRD